MLILFFRIRGAYLVKPFIESEVYEKTKRKGTLAEEAARVASGMSRTLASAMAQKAPAPTKQGKADAKTKVNAQPSYGAFCNEMDLKLCNSNGSY